jgi:hypothetical protein
MTKQIAEIGSPLAGGFFAGEMTIDGERFVLIVAPKASGEMMDLVYKLNNRNVFDKAESDDDGLVNSALINDANHPAVQFCCGLEIGEFSDWYLPSRDELMQLWRNLGPNRKNAPDLFSVGAAEAFQEAWYWSSTEFAQYSLLAWIVGFRYGYQDSFSKSDQLGVRAVRRLKL